MIEKKFQKFSEPYLKSQNPKKTNGVQFRIRMTKNQHKQSKLSKLPFQQTEPKEPAGSVSQPVQTAKKRFKKISEPYLRSQEFKKSNRVQFRLRMTKNQHIQSKLPKLPFQHTEHLNWLVRFPNRSRRLRKYFKNFQNLPKKSETQQDKQSTTTTKNDHEPTQTKQTTQTAFLKN